MSIAPIYTADNCKFAYQLYWSLALFWTAPVQSAPWLSELQNVTQADGLRILKHRFHGSDCSLFLISTEPTLKPSRIAWSVKGRLQHILRQDRARAFQRNYDLRSVGSTNTDKVQAYVAAQLMQHPPASAVEEATFRDLQWSDPEVDLNRPRFTAHGRYSCNLHLVLVHADRRAESRQGTWVSVRNIIRRASAEKKHLLSRIGIVPDHLHLTLGTHADEAPSEVALSYMNNIAYVCDMRPVLMNGCYIGGFGKYDLGAIHETESFNIDRDTSN